MKLEDFLKRTESNNILTETRMNYEKVNRKEAQGVDLAKSWGSKSGNVGASNTEIYYTGSDVAEDTDPKRFNDIKDTLRQALSILPEYGLVSEESPQWEAFKKNIEGKLATKVFNHYEAKAVENGLRPWIISIIDLEKNNPNKQYSEKGGKEFLASLLKDKISRAVFFEEPLRIINTINATGILFPERKKDGKFDGNYTKNKDNKLNPVYDNDSSKDFVQIVDFKLDKNFIKRIKDAFGAEADEKLLKMIKSYARGKINDETAEILKDKAMKLGL